MSHQPIGACIIILNSSKTHLLMGIRKNSYKSGWYGIPGGRVEVGEPTETAAIRELEEETGLKPLKVSYLGVIKEKQEHIDFIHFAYLCEEYIGKPIVMEPDKCEEWQWMEIKNLPKNVLPGHLAAIEMFLSDGQKTHRDL
jgi:8-oxo-dGTP diphosphatase